MAVQILAGYWNLDLKSRELLLCPRSRQMFGIDGDSPKKLKKQDWISRILAHDVPVIEGELEAAGRRNEIYAARFRAVQPDGSLREILGVGQVAVTDKTRFVGLNFDLAAAAATADLECRRPRGTLGKYARALTVLPSAANEDEIEQPPPRSSLSKKSQGSGSRAKEEAACHLPYLAMPATMKLRELRDKLLSPAMSCEPSLDMLLALYVTKATSGILNKSRKAHAARIDTIHEELGQRLASISFAVGAMEVGGDIANSATLIRSAVEEARHELELHRYEARQEVLP